MEMESTLLKCLIMFGNYLVLDAFFVIQTRLLWSIYLIFNDRHIGVFFSNNDMHWLSAE